MTSENHQVTAENRQLMAAKKIGETTNQQLQAEVSWQALERAPRGVPLAKFMPGAV